MHFFSFYFVLFLVSECVVFCFVYASKKNCAGLTYISLSNCSFFEPGLLCTKENCVPYNRSPCRGSFWRIVRHKCSFSFFRSACCTTKSCDCRSVSMWVLSIGDSRLFASCNANVAVQNEIETLDRSREHCSRRLSIGEWMIHTRFACLFYMNCVNIDPCRCGSRWFFVHLLENSFSLANWLPLNCFDTAISMINFCDA